MSTLRLVGIALALLLFQVLAIAVLPDSFRPDLILVFALAMGLRSRGLGPLVWAFAAGFAIDTLSGSPLGLYALLRGTACAASRLLDRALYLRAAGPWAIYVLGYAVVDALLMGVILRLFAPEAAISWGALVLRLPGMALTTAVLAAPLLGLFRWADSDPAREPGFAVSALPGSRARR